MLWLNDSKESAISCLLFWHVKLYTTSTQVPLCDFKGFPDTTYLLWNLNNTTEKMHLSCQAEGCTLRTSSPQFVNFKKFMLLSV